MYFLNSSERNSFLNFNTTGSSPSSSCSLISSVNVTVDGIVVLDADGVVLVVVVTRKRWKNPSEIQGFKYRLIILIIIAEICLYKQACNQSISKHQKSYDQQILNSDWLVSFRFAKKLKSLQLIFSLK